MNYSSQLLENAVDEFAKIPGVGRKTALRHVLHLLNGGDDLIVNLSRALVNLKQHVKYCTTCHNIADDYICSICASPKRRRDMICVVEDIRDVMAVENTQQYFGLYHVLGGLISPMDGVGPADLHIDSLVERAKNEEVREVILALNPNMEGDTTIFYISKKLAGVDVEITTIARGIAFGGELEYADEITLGRSIMTRVPYNANLNM